MDDTGSVNPDGKHVHILEIRVLHVALEQIPKGAAGRLGIGHHEGQFKDLGARETAWRIARHGPDDIRHAVDNLVIKLIRLESASTLSAQTSRICAGTLACAGRNWCSFSVTSCAIAAPPPSTHNATAPVIPRMLLRNLFKIWLSR